MSKTSLSCWLKTLLVEPQASAHLDKRDPADRPKGLSRADAEVRMGTTLANLDRLQYLLYADGGASLLIVLQGLDAAGKDGTIRHVMTGMNPQGVRVSAFKKPTPLEAAHDYLWRAHRAVPGKGEVGIFNRSHYEDVLVARAHNLVPRSIWGERFEQINAFEALLAANGTAILKFFLHISPEEQLKRFEKRLNDPDRQWKISQSDYTERAFWKDYSLAFEEALSRTSTPHAPWYAIPSDHKWVRNLAIAQIIAERLEAMDLKTPPVSVDLADIRRRFHRASGEKI